MLPLLSGYHQSPVFRTIMSLAERGAIEFTLMSYKYCKNKIMALVVRDCSLPANVTR
jgi:hypothetical protein